MQTLKLIWHNLTNVEDNKHHWRTLIALILLSTVAIFTVVQINHINDNVQQIENIKQEIEVLNEQLNESELTILEMQAFDVYLTNAMNAQNELYDSHQETQKELNYNFVTGEELQLEVQRCLENNLEVTND